MKKHLLLAFLATAASGCRAEDPQDIVFDFTIPEDSYVRPDIPGCPAVPTLPAPIVDPYPDPTPNARQPLRGTAIGASVLVAKSSAGTSAPVTVSSDGRFCIEVELVTDYDNQVTLIPRTAAGCEGNITKLQITHESSGQTDAGPPTTITNVAQGAVISSSHAPSPGVLANVNDGDPQSWAEFEFWDGPEIGGCTEGDTSAWIMIDFGKSYTISRVKIDWAPAAEKNYAKCYSVLLNSASSPGTPCPAPKCPGWNVAVQKQEAEPGAQDESINPESARWVALLLYENGSTGLWETFHLAEISVYGQDPNAVPPPPPDRCE